MRYLIRWGFWVVLAIAAGFLGNSRREEKRVDPDKTVMRYMPTYRFGMYFIGIILIGLFGFLGAEAVGDGAQKEDPWIIPMILLGLLFGVLCFLTGYILYAKHIFFDEKGLIVGRPFRSSLSFLWQEIERMEISKNVCAPGYDGVPGRTYFCGSDFFLWNLAVLDFVIDLALTKGIPTENL